LLCSIIGVESFVPNNLSPRHSTNRYNAVGDEDRDDGSGSSFDVENARRRLESLMSTPGAGENDNDNNNDNDAIKNSSETTDAPFSLSKLLEDYDNGVDFSLSSLPPPPPLSAIERSRRSVEIGLLECLSEGDDAITELWDHWYSERGSATKLRLEQTGGMFLDRSKWKECEGALIDLVEEYGVYFVEPVNLLATLYFIQKRYERSFKLCEIILSIKPHHVGALSGIVEVAVCRGDAAAVRYWAEKRLPKGVPTAGTAPGDASAMEERGIPENPRRAEWVERAVATAKEKLDQAERRTQEKFFGEAELYYDNSANKDNRLDDENEDAWQ